jgi:hypothetical protein
VTSTQGRHDTASTVQLWKIFAAHTKFRHQGANMLTLRNETVSTMYQLALVTHRAIRPVTPHGIARSTSRILANDSRMGIPLEVSIARNPYKKRSTKPSYFPIKRTLMPLTLSTSFTTSLIGTI